MVILNKFDNYSQIVLKTSSITLPNFNASLAGLKSSWGWTFAGTPLYAISRSNWIPESAQVRRTSDASCAGGF